MDPVDFDKATEEQKRYASTPISSYLIVFLFLGAFVLALLLR
jgi:hypothetical protein